jgi:hypothetical protein
MPLPVPIDASADASALAAVCALVLASGHDSRMTSEIDGSVLRWLEEVSLAADPPWLWWRVAFTSRGQLHHGRTGDTAPRTSTSLGIAVRRPHQNSTSSQQRGHTCRCWLLRFVASGVLPNSGGRGGRPEWSGSAPHGRPSPLALVPLPRTVRRALGSVTSRSSASRPNVHDTFTAFPTARSLRRVADHCVTVAEAGSVGVELRESPA